MSDLQMRNMMFVSSSIARLMLSALLGGIIGLDRALHRKTAGIRTNMFICMGAAMFTILSNIIPDSNVADRTRIASNIVQGVGFLGAGAILHGKGTIQGLTTAATIWMVASIGMAAGAGHSLLATFATITSLLALNVFGFLETKLGLKAITINYEVKGKSAPEILDQVNEIMEDSHHSMKQLQVGRSQNLSRVLFNLTCSLPEHQTFQARLKRNSEFESVNTFRAANEE